MGINSPIPTNLNSECKKAAKIVDEFINPPKSGKYNPDQLIPDSIIRNCKGIAILSVLKAGFLFSGRAGSGLVIARLSNGSWSAPSAIGTAGMGFGGQIGAELTDFMIILNTNDAVKAFSHGGNVTLGGNLSVAAGPVGRNAEAAATIGNLAAIYSYSKTRGLFAGISIEGSVLVERKDTNAQFYTRKISAKELLSGTVQPPPQAEDLYRALNLRSNNSVYSSSSNSLNNNSGNYHNMPSSYSQQQQQQSSFNNNDDSNDYKVAPGYVTLNEQDNLKQNQINSSFNYNNRSNNNLNNNNNNYTNGNLHSNSEGGFLSSSNSNIPSNNQSQQQQGFSYLTGNSNSNSNSNLSSNIKTAPPMIAPRPNINSQQQESKAVALYDFKGEREGDLIFSKGDIIIILEKSNSTNDWWKGKCNGRQGVFPANYVSLS